MDDTIYLNTNSRKIDNDEFKYGKIIRLYFKNYAWY